VSRSANRQRVRRVSVAVLTRTCPARPARWNARSWGGGTGPLPCAFRSLSCRHSEAGASPRCCPGCLPQCDTTRRRRRGHVVPKIQESQGRFPTSGSPAVTQPIRAERINTTLPYPHQSAVKGSESIRELRPRGGRSRVRPLYRRFADTFVIGAVAPEAQADPRRFDRAVRSATTRFAEIEE